MGNKALQSERARTSKGSKVLPIAVVENNSKEGGLAETAQNWEPSHSEVEIFDFRSAGSEKTLPSAHRTT